MKYTVEFSIPLEIGNEQKEMFIEYQKKRSSADMGNLIEKAVGFDTYVTDDRYRMCIEAFSEKDWRDFKEELRDLMVSSQQLGTSNFYLHQVINLVKSIENK